MYNEHSYISNRILTYIDTVNFIQGIQKLLGPYVCKILLYNKGLPRKCLEILYLSEAQGPKPMFSTS